VERAFRPYWQRCDGLESAFEFHPADPSDTDKAINDFLLAPLDPFNGPQVRVGLFRSCFDTLYIKMSHIVADGGASIEFLRLLSGIYCRLGTDPEYRPASNLRGSRSSFQVLRHVGLKKILSSCTHISLSKPAWKLPEVDNGPALPSFFTRRIGPERISRIKAYGKTRGVTIGDILVTAYYRVLFEVLDPPENVPLPMLVPVDLRKYIPGGAAEGICSLTAGYFPMITRMRGELFEETLARVHAVMESNKLKQEELGQLFLMELAFAPGYIVPRILGPFITSLQAVPTFSNIGVVDPNIADFGVAIREILPAGPMSTPPYFVLGSNTYNGEMALTAIVCGSEVYRAKVESFFEALIRELPEYMPDEPHVITNAAARQETAREKDAVSIREKSPADA
jgi:NRPS condensation-like uncharacterized protein